MGGQRATLQEIAMATGFSANTVSRALKNNPKISKATRSVIQKKAREMGYVPNLAAASLRLGHSHVLALIVESLTNPFFGMIFNHVDRAAGALGYEIIVFCSHCTEEGELRAIQTACQHGCDGVILISCAHTCATVDFLRATQTPFVLLFREIRGCDVDCVLCDEEEGGRCAARFLMGQGYTRLLYANSFQMPFSLRRRQEGFEAETKRGGASFELLQPETDDAHQANCAAAARIMEICREGGQPGIAVYCDMRAYGILSALFALEGSAQTEVGLIGFDNIDAITPSSLPFSSVSADYAGMCDQAVGILHRRLLEEATATERFEYPMFVVGRKGFQKSGLRV